MLLFKNRYLLLIISQCFSKLGPGISRAYAVDSDVFVGAEYGHVASELDDTAFGSRVRVEGATETF